MIGLIGKKIGMTQIFAADNQMVGVTAIEAGPCPILMVMDKNLQLGFDLAKEKSLKKAHPGLYKKLNIAPRKVIKDLSKEAGVEYKAGDELKVDLFTEGEYVDVSGISIGKGFAGGMNPGIGKAGRARTVQLRTAGSVQSVPVLPREEFLKGIICPGTWARKKPRCRI